MVGANRQDASLTVVCQPLSQRHASAALEGRHDLGGGTCPVAEGLRDHPPVRVPNHRLAAPPTPGGSFSRLVYLPVLLTVMALDKLAL